MAILALQVLTNEEGIVRTRLNKITGVTPIKTYAHQLTLKDNAYRSTDNKAKDCFPGYVLIEIEGEIEHQGNLYHAIKETPGVISVLGGVVTADEMEHIYTIASDIGVIEVKKNNLSAYDILCGLKEKAENLKQTTLGWFRKVTTRRGDRYEFPLRLFTREQITQVDLSCYPTNECFAKAVTEAIGMLV